MLTSRKTLPSKPDERPVLDPQKGKVLRELERHGYVAEQHLAGSPGGAVYRHPVAPSMLVWDDGRIELLGGEPDPQDLGYSQRPAKRIRWDRSLLFLALLGVTVFLGLLVVAMVVG